MNKHTSSVSLIDGHIEEMTDAEVITAMEDYRNSPIIFTKKGIISIGDIIDLIKRQQAEIERLNVELVGMRGACESYKMHYDNAQTEIERLKKENQRFADIGKMYSEVRAEAIKEFWKRFDKVLCENIGPSKRVYWKISSDGNNLVKEMTEVSE